MNRVAGKVAIVTGGAQSVGAASARMLAREGAHVVITDIKDDEGEEVAKSIKKDGAIGIYVHHDVSSDPEWKAVIRRTINTFGKIDVLVNNANVEMPCSPEDQTLAQWRFVMSINLDGVFLGVKHAIASMKQNLPKGGSIINVSSIEGIVGVPNLGAFNASKGGIRLYTKSVALYCAKESLGIRANSVHVGYISTSKNNDDVLERSTDVRARELENALRPMGQIGEPDDAAFGVVYLASDESKFMTGAELVIDGGYTAQ